MIRTFKNITTITLSSQETVILWYHQISSQCSNFPLSYKYNVCGCVWRFVCFFNQKPETIYASLLFDISLKFLLINRFPSFFFISCNLYTEDTKSLISYPVDFITVWILSVPLSSIFPIHKLVVGLIYSGFLFFLSRTVL